MGPLSGRSPVYTGMESIDLADDRYRVTRSRPAEMLYGSIAQYGVLEPPVLLRTHGKNIIVFGHNRLRVCAEKAIAGTECIVVDEVRSEWYTKYAVLRNYRGEISPYGKLRLARILCDMPDLSREEAIDVLRTGFAIPAEYAAAPDKTYADLASLPGELRDYLDCRDIGFKIIGRVLRLPLQAQSLIARWIAVWPLRVNVFREAVDMMLDICRRDGSIDAVSAAAAEISGEAGAFEDAIIRHLQAVRYPHYSGLKEKAGALMAEIGGDQAVVAMPRNFEGDTVEVSLRFSRRDDEREIAKRLGSVRADRIRALLDLL